MTCHPELLWDESSMIVNHYESILIDNMPYKDEIVFSSLKISLANNRLFCNTIYKCSFIVKGEMRYIQNSSSIFIMVSEQVLILPPTVIL